MLLNTGDSLWSDRWETLRQRKVFGVIFTPALTHDACKSGLPLCYFYGLEFIFRMQTQPESWFQLNLVSAFRSGRTRNYSWPQRHVIVDFRSKSMHVKALLILKQTVPSMLHPCHRLLCLTSFNHINQLRRCGCLKKKRLKSEALSSVTNKRGRLTVRSLLIDGAESSAAVISL